MSYSVDQIPQYIYFQDYATLTDANSIDITIVDPDDFAVKQINVTTAVTDPLDQIQVGSTTQFQLRYQGEDLPWVGRVEKGYSGQVMLSNHPTSALAPGAGATTWVSDVTSNSSGQLTISDQCGFFLGFADNVIDDESAEFRVDTDTMPVDAGRFTVYAYKRHLRNVENSNSEIGSGKPARHCLMMQPKATVRMIRNDARQFLSLGALAS
jgi:hypothetical protein